ncbi:2-iminobutanoate/2-iminopropanoate deaminase isoform X1 [Hydra vulgaris]|uniref:2-iminobutanoate/2-iminopropanoate deaminase isoform X2 n=1 Tax=Hydra vulgaris TaxID=6087 RepID=T2MFM6_HYDVU|nr:2-iminobutanoate/2-iminopropanoate deaminase [Hydra vulgaris]
MSSVIRKVIYSAKAPKAIGPYSQAIQVNHVLHISGQLGINAETNDFVSDSVEDQAKQALTNIGYILDAAGSSFDKVIETTVLLADINDFAKVNEIYASFFKVPYPARAAYQCANLPKFGKIEIKSVAIVGDIHDE